MTSIELEPARYAMTGGGFFVHFRDGYKDEGYPGWCIDAPDMIPRGSVRLGQTTAPNGKQYADTSEVRGRQ